MKNLSRGSIDIEYLFKKRWSNGNKGAIMVSEEKPTTLCYSRKKSELTVVTNYTIKNKYGIEML